MDLPGIDSFQSEIYPQDTPQINIIKRKEWDIPDHNTFIFNKFDNVLLPKCGIYTNIKSSGRDEIKRKVIKCLDLMTQYVYTLKNVMLKNKEICIQESCYNEAAVFIATPCILQEIPSQKKFEGINKPKNIVSFYNGDRFKRDNNYRAGYRLIMLRLRNDNGSMRIWEDTSKKIKKSDIKSLLLHELSHTMCNHVTYREDENHDDDFYKSERFITMMANNSTEVKVIEDKIKKLL